MADPYGPFYKIRMCGNPLSKKTPNWNWRKLLQFRQKAQHVINQVTGDQVWPFPGDKHEVATAWLEILPKQSNTKWSHLQACCNLLGASNKQTPNEGHTSSTGLPRKEHFLFRLHREKQEPCSSVVQLLKYCMVADTIVPKQS